MRSKRSQFIPWRAAGRASERQVDGDDVVRTTGWVFNNETRGDLTLASFVATGDEEVGSYLELFDLGGADDQTKDMVEIGSGIGRMTCGFTRRFRCVIACDLDAGFLERCRESVARFGRPAALRTMEVVDGRTIELPDNAADLAFSFITLQHCRADDALALTAEAVRVVKPGGRIAVNFRRRRAADAVLIPVGSIVRVAFKIPGLGAVLSRRRSLTRLGWQANRLAPADVLAAVGQALTDAEIWHSPERDIDGAGAATRTFYGINPSHWWLVATVR